MFPAACLMQWHVLSKSVASAISLHVSCSVFHNLFANAGSAIGYRINFQRRPQSPPIGGLPQGTSYDFVTEDEPEVDERVLQALRAAAGDRLTSNAAGTSASSSHGKRRRKEERRRDGDEYSPDSRDQLRYWNTGSEVREDRGDGSRFRSFRQAERHRADVEECDRHHRDQYIHSREREREREYEVDRKRGRYSLRDEDESVRCEQRDMRDRTDHDRRVGSHRAVWEDSRSQGRDEMHRRECVSDGEQDSDTQARKKKEKGGGRERSHKDKKSKKRGRERKEEATLEDAVRFIVEQGLSAEEVLNELRSKKKM
jgi:hypothetical protein